MLSAGCQSWLPRLEANFDFLKTQGESIKGDQNAKIFSDCKILEALGDFNRKMEKCLDHIEVHSVNRSGTYPIRHITD